MAQLSSVIGSILRDIISAQHEANLYSLALSENYGRDGRAKDFQLPGVFISDMEMELKYGIVGSSENQEQFNIRYNKFRRFIGPLCTEAAKTVVSAAVSAVLGSDAGRSEEEKRFFYRLRRERELSDDFIRYLVRNMRSALSTNLHESVDARTGEVVVGVVVDKLTDTAVRRFLDSPDLDGLFEGADGRALKESAAADIRTALEGLVAKLAQGVNFKRVKSFPRLDVAVAAGELAEMPEEAIHLFKLKFSPVTCSVGDMEDAEEPEGFDMK